MKISSFSSEQSRVNSEKQYYIRTEYDIENMFNIFLDKSGKEYKFNLNETVYFDIAPEFLKTYTVTSETQWPIISYMLYNTTQLVWLLLKINDIKKEYSFKRLTAGMEILYLDKQYIPSILYGLDNDETDIDITTM